MLENLENLETVTIRWGPIWKIPSTKTCQKIKYLKTSCKLDGELCAEQFTKTFPNLEYLKIEDYSIKLTESFLVTLLSGLKQLKSLHMEIWSERELDSKSALECFQEYGENLEDAKISFNFLSYEIGQYSIVKKARGSFFINQKDFHDFDFSQYSRTPRTSNANELCRHSLIGSCRVVLRRRQ